MDIIPDLINTGIDGINPIDSVAGMDAADLRRRYGKSLLMSGGIDKRALAKDRHAIDEELSKLPSVMEQGG